MFDEPRPALAPVFGQANQHLREAVADVTRQIGSNLLARKGRLYLLLPTAIDPALAQRIYRAYYEAPSYDILSELRRALAQTLASGEFSDLPVAGLVICGLDLYATANSGATVLLVRNGNIVRLLPEPSAPIALPTPTTSLVRFGESTAGVRRRLYAGDAIVLTTDKAADRLTPRIMRRALGHPAAGDATAQVLARAAGNWSRRQAPPVSIVRLPGYSAIALEAPPKKTLPPQPLSQDMLQRSISPIWLALALSIVAIAVTLLIKRPQIDWKALGDLITTLIITVPTETPLAPTDTPTAMPEDAD